MARKDLLGELAKKPLPVKLAILGGVLAALGLIYYQLMYSPLKDSYNEAKSKHARLIKQNKRLKKREREYKQLLARQEELQTSLQHNLVSLPASSELPSFFVHLQKQAATSGVEVQKWDRKKERPVSDYIKVPVAMTITGTFYQIMNYFQLLHETERIISVENLSLGGPKIRNDEIVLTAKFNASTFRQKDLPPSLNGSDDGKGKAGKKKSKSGK
jgi:type IV pilus assembly protein PilO